MFTDTILEDSDVVEINDLLKVVKTNSKFFNILFLGIQLARLSELGFEEYFYPPYIGIREKCIWLDKFNNQSRISMYFPQNKLTRVCLNKKLEQITEFTPKFSQIGSPND